MRLSARRSGNELHLAVWNRGAEIPPESSAKLFEAFYTTRDKGTGLGLAFVRDIAHDHGGRVEVVSKSRTRSARMRLRARRRVHPSCTRGALPAW